MTSGTSTQPEYILELEAGDSNAAQGAQGDAQVFKKYSQMKLQMKRDAPLEKLNRRAGEMAPAIAEPMCTVTVQ
jgi:hypothetical protein